MASDNSSEQSNKGSNHGKTAPRPDSTAERFWRFLLAGAFPLVVTAVIVATGIVLELHSGKANVAPSTMAGQMIAVAAVAGVASMAVVQVVKSLFGLRGLYQQRQVKRWIEGRPGGRRGYQQFLDVLTPADAGDEERSERSYLFDLPIEQLCAQVSGAADLALESPNGEYVDFLNSLAGKSLTDARGNQIQSSHSIRAGIDQLQVSVGHRWRAYIRATAVWLSGLIGIAIVVASPSPAHQRGLDILAAVLVGGFISWFARDITAVVERLRN
jgi:hypothetical protein